MTGRPWATILNQMPEAPSETMTAPHLLVAISSHGFGHVSQVAPVVNALRTRLPELRVTVRTTAPRQLLESRIHTPFARQVVADDFGMVQIDAIHVDTEASAARYRAFHAAWDQRVEGVAADLSATEPDLILADVPYLTLAAAARAGIPAYALCSLNWADIYRHYCGRDAEGERIAAQMLAAYRSARLFLRPAPAMPMEDLGNTRAVGPIAVKGVNRRAELIGRCGLGEREKLVLVTLGGITTRLPAEEWPRLPGVRWVFQRDWAVKRPDALVLEELGLGFSDLLASVDLLLTKPGYGSFVEAAAAGVPVLYVERQDWPESPCLTEWLARHGRCAPLTPEEAVTGRFGGTLLEMLDAGAVEPVATAGAAEAAELLSSALACGRRIAGAIA